MQKIRQFLIAIRSSLWFVPGLMIISSIILAFFLIEVDSSIKHEWLVKYPRIFGLGADGSRGMLTAIASSMLTVAALAFSLTLSIISQASGQYTPRILRNFMRNKINQFTLGYFVSVYAYCLIILRTIRGADDMQFVPSLGAVVGLILAIGGIIVLIYFIHHIASSLQVASIITDIEEETSEVIKKIFPEQMGEEAEEEEEVIRAKKMEERIDWHDVKSLLSGYVQYVDTDRLMKFADENNLLLRMECGIGQFVAEGTTLISATKSIDKDSIDRLNSFFNVYPYRTIEQDAGYGIRQIVDIALKALSPGVNDTTTAINCIDYLAIIVGKIAGRKLPTLMRVKDGEIRVFVKSPSFRNYMEAAFDQIRINGKTNLAVFSRLLKALSIVGEKTISAERKKIVKEHIILTKEFAEETLQTKYEKKLVRKLVSKELKKIRDGSPILAFFHLGK